MKGRLIFAAALAGCLLLRAQTRVSTNYGTTAESFNAGGAGAASASYGHAGSVGLVSGDSTSVAYLVTAGFLPQTATVAAGPEIAVFDGAAVSPAAERQSQGRFNFPTTAVGNSSGPQTFTLKNTGTTDLTGLAVTVAGNQPGDFAVGALGATTLAPEATTAFTVTFSPGFAGARTAVLQIASNDADENPFVINLASNETVTATYSAGTDVPLTANGFIATGGTVNLTLNFTPGVMTQLMVVKNTSLDFIVGRFNNLAQGQVVPLSFGGITYYFVANYYGGTGNDLVLVPAATRVFSWGQNANGQAGDGSTTNRPVPGVVTSTGILGGKTALALATGAAHSLVLCSDGTLLAWGRNDAGQLGDGTTTQRLAPVAVTTAGTPLAGRTVVAIAVGDSHSLALCSDGTLVAWGYNAGGQLGDGTVTSRLTAVAVTTAATVLAGKSVVGIAAGRHHSAALCSDGSVATWGLNFYGELGDGTTTDRHLPVMVTTAGTPLAGKSVAALAAGAYHNLALCTDGTLAAWGKNDNGQLGDGTAGQQNIPVAVITGVPALAGKTVTALAAGAAHSLALCSDGKVASWGDNTYGQLGNGISGQPVNPLAVAVSTQPGLSALVGATVTGIAAGTNHSFVTFAGDLATWGSNAAGQMGNPAFAARAYPTLVDPSGFAGGERVIRLGGGGYSDHSLAVVASPPLPEISVFNGAGTAAVDERQSNAGSFSFAATTVGDGTVQTFTIKNTGTFALGSLAVTKAGSHPGDFTLGALGATTLAPGATTTFTVTFSPTVEGARSALVQIASDDPDENPFLINLDGTGVGLAATYNAAGDVPATASSFTATGKTINLTLNFVPLVGTTLLVVRNTGPAPITGRFTNLAQSQLVGLTFGGNTYYFIANYYGGTGNDLVLLWATNRAFGWGQNASGQIGDGTTTPRSSPAPVTATGVLAGKTITSLAMGQGHSLAVCSDGTLAAWGDNTYGQLGDGTNTARSAPVAVTTVGTPLAGKTVIAVAAGVFHSLALCSDGTVATWGYNNFGQLGDGTNTDRSVPGAVVTSGFLSGKTVVSVAGGSLFSVALCSNGTVATWGYNSNGQLGTNGGGHSSVPVAVTTSTALSGKTVVGITVGVNHTLALCSDGTLASWGFNFSGELGDGTFGSGASRFAPVAVTTSGALSGKTVVATAAGEHHSLALCSDGTLLSWGQNSSGQLGFFGTDFPTPVGVTVTGTALAGKTVAGIAAGISQSFAMCSDGTLTAWGKNDAGQLGDGTTAQRSQAVAVDTSTLAPGERFIRIFGGSNNDHTLALVGSPPPAPEISVFEGSGTGGIERQNNAGTFAHANTLVGANSPAQVFTIQNTGTLTLTGLALAKTGVQSGDFTLGALGAVSLAPGSSTSFTVTFAPTAGGVRNAAVQIASNDADENPFVINLSSLALTPQDAWRQAHFGTTANSGNAANTADPDGDGLVNLVEYALGLDPLGANTLALPQVSTAGSDWVYTYTRPAATTDVTYVVEVSTDLSTWTTAGITHEIVSSSGGTETWHALYPLSSATNIFFRLKVSVP